MDAGQLSSAPSTQRRPGASPVHRQQSDNTLRSHQHTSKHSPPPLAGLRLLLLSGTVVTKLSDYFEKQISCMVVSITWAAQCTEFRNLVFSDRCKTNLLEKQAYVFKKNHSRETS